MTVTEFAHGLIELAKFDVQTVQQLYRSKLVNQVLYVFTRVTL